MPKLFASLGLPLVVMLLVLTPLLTACGGKY
jgi:hypothetical protein